VTDAFKNPDPIREAIARIIDPHAFDDSAWTGKGASIRERLQATARGKADQVLSMTFVDELLAPELLQTVSACEEALTAEPISAIAAELRAYLLSVADIDAVLEATNSAIERVNSHLNDRADRRQLTEASSLLARALIANGVLKVAAAWWSDQGAHPDAAGEALRSFLDDMPPQLQGTLQ
jgi:hypothetical protein